ncbi:MAG: LacI family DNA-binding transcriptional regulator [Candidatus Omnitrophota bacterium]|nr:LacI family DNA-binding transcriptional regulator [Candidatus Omnitrophota bacterium]
MKLTIYEIAKKAKVSIATVSRAMNPETRSKVSPDTLKRVDAIIARHQYAPNLAAKGLTQAVYRTLGVLVPHGEGVFLNDYYAQILCGVSDALLNTPYRFKVLMLKCGETHWNKYDFKAAEGIDGLIVTHWHAFFSDKSAFRNLSVPCVILGDPEKNVHAHFVSGDQAAGGKLAAEYLYGQGHRKIAVMTGAACSVDSRLRLEGFRGYLKKKGIGLDQDMIVCGDFREEKAEEAAAQLLKKRKDFSAMFCLNDAMARGAIQHLSKAGRKCPSDVSVVGFDDEKAAATMSPPLTTVRMPLYDVAKRGAEIMIGHLGKKAARGFYGNQTLLPAEFVERKTVSRA